MAKKSMIEREKKRIRLEKKYALKRTNLLNNYKNETSFNEKLEIHAKLHNEKTIFSCSTFDLPGEARGWLPSKLNGKC